jgi:hypothetical protein
MDQMFSEPDFPVYELPGGMVANAVLQNPQWQADYRQRVLELLPLFAPDKLNAILDPARDRMRPVLAAMGEDRARQFDDQVRDLKNRVAERQKNIRQQLPPEPLRFGAQGWVHVETWEPKSDGDARLERKEQKSRQYLLIATGPSGQCIASFRSHVRLGPGNYRFEGKLKTAGVQPLADEKGPGGASLRISGEPARKTIAATADWQTISFPIEVSAGERDVDLVAELRSTAGGALFDLDSLRIVKAK